MRLLSFPIHQYPVAFAITVATLAVMTFAIGQGAYWALAQSDPQIIERGTSYFHRGVNAEGMTFTQWKAAGFPEGDWLPAPAVSARPGESLWLRRDLEFTNKTLATVTRVLKCEGGYQFGWNPMQPQTRTEARTVKHFQVVIPAGAAGACVYEVAAIFYKNPSQPEVRVAFQPVPILVVFP